MSKARGDVKKESGDDSDADVDDDLDDALKNRKRGKKKEAKVIPQVSYLHRFILNVKILNANLSYIFGYILL